ncbi:MAG: response regulator [Spirochaetes bacterium]|nr:response regulator [Spirochaetota bacterium]
MKEENEEKIPIVLMVDDNPKNLQVLGQILAQEGYEIIAAMNGIQALEALQELKPDLILLDIMMPDMNGFEVCEKIKQVEDIRDLPVIFLTAKVETEDIVRGFNVGAVDYVTKPFNREELLARVRTHLELKNARERLEKAIEEIKTLRGFIPICAHCKKVRDKKGIWEDIEDYLHEHALAEFTHSLCEDCAKELYGEFLNKEET